MPQTVAVLGCGSIGKRHLANLRALGVPRVIGYDPRPDRRAEVAPDVEVVETMEQVWAAAPDAVVIATPPAHHLAPAMDAVTRGCHLFVEKPLAASRDGVDALVRAVEEAGLVSMVGCNMRFHPALRRIKDLVDGGAIGQVLAARVEVGRYLPDWHPWEDYRLGYSASAALGGGIILDAIHEIDYTRWLLGEITAVSCFAGHISDLEIDTEDVAQILLRTTTGALASIHLDYVQAAYSRTCHLIGVEGTIRWEWSAGTVRRYTRAAGWTVEHADAPDWDVNAMYIDEMAHFLRCIDAGAQTTLDVAGGARVLEIALAAREAAASGTVVSLEGAHAGR